MELIVINTGSSGNCYAVAVEGKYLLLDCGVPYARIAQALQFKMSSVVGCLLSHEHGDHAIASKELIKRGIKVYTSLGTSLVIQGGIVVRKFEPFKAGPFTITAFDVPHDAAEPFGFLISHSDFGILCFITDAMYCKYNFPGVKHLLVEANYSRELLRNDPEFLQRRIATSHMSIETCCEFIEVNKKDLQTIILIHLSDRNSDAEEYKSRIQKEFGKRVYIADKNQTITL